MAMSSLVKTASDNIGTNTIKTVYYTDHRTIPKTVTVTCINT